MGVCRQRGVCVLHVAAAGGADEIGIGRNSWDFCNSPGGRPANKYAVEFEASNRTSYRRSK